MSEHFTTEKYGTAQDITLRYSTMQYRKVQLRTLQYTLTEGTHVTWVPSADLLVAWGRGLKESHWYFVIVVDVHSLCRDI